MESRRDFKSVQAKEEAAIGDAEATQRAKTLQELLSKEVPIVGMKVDVFVDGRLMCLLMCLLMVGWFASELMFVCLLLRL